MRSLTLAIPLVVLAACAQVQERDEQSTEISAQAQDLYRQASFYLVNGSNRGGPMRAAVLLEQAVDVDPNFGLAWAALAQAYVKMYFFGADGRLARLEMAEAAVQRAQTLVPDAPEVQQALGQYYYQGLRGYPRAAEYLAAAQEGMPDNAELFRTPGSTRSAKTPDFKR